MATSVVVTSDLSGLPGATPRFVTVGSVAYQVDMTDSEFAEYESVVSSYIEVGRKVSLEKLVYGEAGLRRPRGRRSSEETAAIKTWARENGYAFQSRGRLPQVLLDAYQRAHPAGTGVY
ncbi:MAG: Lsr2 family protein [Propionibacteriaceae bacterium]|jgi:hypothetical protein|nr:Lsr2 family protein [Propionibacteriaceae bacterium]